MLVLRIALSKVTHAFEQPSGGGLGTSVPEKTRLTAQTSLCTKEQTGTRSKP